MQVSEQMGITQWVRERLIKSAIIYPVAWGFHLRHRDNLSNSEANTCTKHASSLLGHSAWRQGFTTLSLPGVSEEAYS